MAAGRRVGRAFGRSWLSLMESVTEARVCLLCQQALPPFVLPEAGAAWPTEAYLCAACAKQLPWRLREEELLLSSLELPLYAFWRFRGVARLLIHHLKFEGNVLAADCLAAFAARYRYQALAGFDAFVPLPLSPQRERERGFNQAAALAEALSVRLHTPCGYYLRRIREGREQSSLGRHARLANLRQVYALDPKLEPDALCGQRLLLIDDVTTTGASLAAAAEVLRRGGAACSALAMCSEMLPLVPDRVKLEYFGPSARQAPPTLQKAWQSRLQIGVNELK